MVHWLWTFTLFFKSIYQNTGLDGTDSKMQIKQPCLHLVVTFNGLFWSLSFMRNDIIFLMALGPACLDDAWLSASQCILALLCREVIITSNLPFYPLSSGSSKSLCAESGYIIKASPRMHESILESFHLYAFAISTASLVAVTF